MSAQGYREDSGYSRGQGGMEYCCLIVGLVWVTLYLSVGGVYEPICNEKYRLPIDDYLL